ncbi:MAG: hypothetical protein ACJAYJ_001589 [Saprospiraceae bacterium]|jgi:hypothetical protein
MEFEGEKRFLKTVFLPQESTLRCRRQRALYFLKLENFMIFSLFKFKTNLLYTAFNIKKVNQRPANLLFLLLKTLF